MTNASLKATFGRKFITSTGLEHPEQLRTPRGSKTIEMLSTPDCVRITATYTDEQDAAAAMLIELQNQCVNSTGVSHWQPARCGYEALRETADDLSRAGG